MAAARATRVANVAPRKTIDAGEQDLGNPGVAQPGPGASIIHEIETVEPVRGDKAKADAMAFNEEKVVVRVLETDDQFAPQFVDIFVNGKPQRFWRGRDTVCARKFLEGLCRAKPVSYRNQEYVDHDGIRGYRWPARTGFAHNFLVVEDKNPLGPAWLKRLMQENK